MKETDVIKMEFLITLNNNIVIQRYFNVRDYNPQARSSMELYQYLKDFVGGFEYGQKMRSVVYLLENKDEILENPSILQTSNTEGPETFNFLIKVGEQTICHRILDAKLFPPKIRYTVDIRQQVKSVLKDLTDIFSDEKFVTSYMTYSLI
jgi:hypothetical protein